MYNEYIELFPMLVKESSSLGEIRWEIFSKVLFYLKRNVLLQIRSISTNIKLKKTKH